MKHKVIKIGDSVAYANIANGTKIEVQQITGDQLEVGEVFDMTEEDAKKMKKLKTKKGRDNVLNAILKDMNKENK
jgi:hypothetical protein